MGLDSLGGIDCTLLLCNKTYEAFLAILWERNGNMGLDTFAQRDA